MKVNRACFLIFGAAALAYACLVRPWYMTWGATSAERERAWPGDEFSPDAGDNAVRAITIHASPSRIWPWIMQIGQDRAGFYSYTVLENLLLAGMRNTFRLIPDVKPRFVGDVVWLANRRRYGNRAGAFVVQLEPERYMVTVSKSDLERFRQGRTISGSWSWILEPAGERRTRLIMRSRRQNRTLADKLVNLFYDPAHFIMEQRMMRSLKELAEGPQDVPRNRAVASSSTA